jgi:hypothetical protein
MMDQVQLNESQPFCDIGGSDGQAVQQQREPVISNRCKRKIVAVTPTILRRSARIGKKDVVFQKLTQFRKPYKRSSTLDPHQHDQEVPSLGETNTQSFADLQPVRQLAPENSSRSRLSSLFTWFPTWLQTTSKF